MLLHIGLLLAIIYFVLGLKKPRIALITVPITCGVFVFIMFTGDNDGTTFEAFFAIVAVIVAALSSLLFAAARRASTKWPTTWATRPLTWAKWLLLIFAFLFLEIIGFIVLVNVPAFGFPFMILFVVTIALIGVAINYGLTSRHATATYVVSTIGACMRQNLPLPMALESAAARQNDERARALLLISKWLVQGYSLAESIKRGFPKCPSYASAMIAAAERINQLPQAFASIEADMTAKSEESKKIEPVSPFYPIVLVTAVGFLVWGMMTLVVPLWSQVLTEITDFGQFPAATRALIRIASFIGLENRPLFLIVLTFTIVIVVPYCVYIRFRQRRPSDPYTSSRIGDFLKWHLPVLRSFEKNSSVLHVAELLRLSLNAGETVNGAISNALSLDLNNCFRKRLQAWLEKVEAGENISAAARKSRVGSSLAWAFDDKANQGNTPAVLETVESLHRSNYNYKANLVRFIASPCVTLIMGSLVGFVIYAIFSAPVSIIHYLADVVYP
ncbi:MAG: type II secretion system F family protein [Sedimentisphaerales bacterium]|nr:type II secretion system F family protein [Sedimentisphaerales bacterium]